MKTIITLLFLVLVSFPLSAQPKHIGALVSYQAEGSASGNGTIAGLEIQSVEDLKLFAARFKLATNATFTVDKKVYRNQFGGAVRATSLLRYSLPGKASPLFIQGGINASGIAFPNMPGTSDGYVKYAVRPVVGGGVAFTGKDFSVVGDYQFLFKRKLFSHGLPVVRGRSVVDGWTSGQKVGVQTTFNLNEKWLILFNGTAGWYTYQRNPLTYGAALGSVVHKFNAYEVSLGLGRRR